MSIARNVATVGSATLVSRLLAFFRDMAIAALLGAGAASDAFFAVLQLTNFFRRMLAEGALNSAFVPLWLRIKATRGEDGAYRFFQEIIDATIVAAVVLVAVGVLGASSIIDVVAPGFAGERHDLATDYLHVAAPYIGIVGVVALLAALLNAEGRVGAVALGTILFNVVLLLALGWIFVFRVSLPGAIGAMLAHAIVFAGTAQFVLTGAAFFRLRRKRMRLAFGLSADALQFFKMAIPGLIAAGVPQLKLIAGAVVASASPAAVSWLYYTYRLYELPLGVVSIAIASVMVPAIAAAVHSDDAGQIASAQSRALEIALALALPAAVAFAVLAESIAGGLFERGAFGPGDTQAVAGALAAISAGLPGHVLEKVFGAVSFAHEDTRTPMFAALMGLATATIGAVLLFPDYGHVGIAAAIAISGWVGATLMAIVLVSRKWLKIDRAALARLPKIVAATIIMGVAIYIAQRYLAARPASSTASARLGLLAVLVAAGLGVYLTGLQLLGVARLRDVIRAVRHRL